MLLASAVMMCLPYSCIMQYDQHGSGDFEIKKAESPRLLSKSGLIVCVHYAPLASRILRFSDHQGNYLLQPHAMRIALFTWAKRALYGWRVFFGGSDSSQKDLAKLHNQRSGKSPCNVRMPPVKNLRRSHEAAKRPAGYSGYIPHLSGSKI